MEAWRMNTLVTILSAIMISLPAIIVWVIGIALALSRWRRHPRVSQSVGAASAKRKTYFPRRRRLMAMSHANKT
jgi:hypothetical protein